MTVRSPTRSRRGLLVRDAHGLGEIADAIRRAGFDPPREVENLFDAIAELSRDDPSRPTPSTLAVGLRAEGFDAAAVRSAARTASPDVRLVLLAPRGTAREADAAGFDEVVFLPAPASQLAAAFAGPLNRPAETAERSSEAESSRSEIRNAPESDESSLETRMTAVSSSPELGGPTRHPPSAHERRGGVPDLVDEAVGQALAAFAARSARPASPPTAAPSAPTSAKGTPPPSAAEGSPLGDTDLVDAVLKGTGSMLAVAQSVIRQELSTSDLRIESAEDLRDAIDADRAAPVRIGTETRAWLTSRTLTPSQLAPWALWLGHWLRLDRVLRQREHEAWTDDLTGAGNRRAFERTLEQAIAAARPERRPVTLMCFDIDNFKLYNDQYGHDAGDQVLREVVQLLRAVIRRGDHVFRIGGDEFVVIFADSRGVRAAQESRGANFDSVEVIAHRFRDRVSTLTFPSLGVDAPGSLSISAGVATYPWDGNDAAALLKHADQLALQSKRAGKNMLTFGPGAKDHCKDC